MQRSRIFLTAGAALSLAACADQSPVATGAPDAAPLHAAAARGIDGQYIVVLNEGADPRSVAAVAGVSPRHVYTAALNGFSAWLNAGQLNALRHNPNVAYVEQDQEVRAAPTITAVIGTTPWGLDRINQRSLPLDGNAGRFGATGAGVRAYVIDTGINTSHLEFGGRAKVGYDAFGGNGQDCNGHGTDVAAIIGGSTYGVAKGVSLISVRVLDCNGSGTVSGIIGGVDWVRLNRINPAVANMSLSTGLSSALNTAVTSMTNASVFTAVMAGNSNANACNYSPPSAPSATTVAASTITDARATYGNYGSCVDLYAPGTNIPTISGTRSGTDMASPHVAGVAALYKQANPTAATLTVDGWIKNNATPNVISGNPTGTPNRLLYNGTL